MKLDFFKEFIKNLQNSDDSTKIKWLVVFVILAFLIVFLIWIVYINLIFPKTGPSTQEPPRIQVQGKNGLFKILWVGLKSIVYQIVSRTQNAFNYFKSKVESKREIFIENNNLNSVLENQQN